MNVFTKLEIYSSLEANEGTEKLIAFITLENKKRAEGEVRRRYTKFRLAQSRRRYEREQARSPPAYEVNN